MKILRISGNYQRRHIRAYSTIAVVCLFSASALCLTWVLQFPVYFNFGRYEFGRGTYTMLFLVIGLLSFKQYRSYRRGAEGEKQVSSHLGPQLNDDFYLINDVMRLDGRGNIDHVILSPSGVFVLETKNNRGKITFYGDNWNYGWSPVYQVKGNASNIHDMIESSGVLGSRTVPYVIGIVVFPNAQLSFKYEPSTPVLNLSELPGYLRNFANGRTQYSLEELFKIKDVILNNSDQMDAVEASFSRILWNDIRGFFF